MCRQFDSGPRHRTKSAITSMTEPALAMLAGGVTMRPPSRHRWDGTDLLASRSCGAGRSSLAHSDHAGHNRVLIGIAHADRAREERWLRAPIHSMEIDADPRAELEHKS